MKNKECIAMLLAGGQGSRLRLLTKDIAKPAVPFGGKYRIIDFSLSNCANSGIDTVGVLTQYKPQLLNSYLGVGSAWDLDCRGGGLYILPPYVGEKGGQWYKGTAHAVYQNIDFIEYYRPRYVLVISGDHIYKMDYTKLIQYHKEKMADVTIAVVEVEWEEASRFGIMSTDSHGRIREFQEKPQNPTSNLASMGVYVFNWEVLKYYLLQDVQDPNSDNDFGKNIIPKMLQKREKMYAYPFQGYWKDVGNIESYWTANMDILDHKIDLDLFDSRWKIHSFSPLKPPHYIAPSARVKQTLVSEDCTIFGEVDHSILFHSVSLGEGSKVKDSIIMPGVKIGRNVRIEKAIIGENTSIGDGSLIGGEYTSSAKTSSDSLGITVIESNLELAEGSQIGVLFRLKRPESKYGEVVEI